MLLNGRMTKYILRKYKALLSILVIVTFFESILSIPLPYLSKHLIDNVMLKGNYDQILILFLSFLAVLSFQFLASNVIARILAYLETDIVKNIRFNIIKFIYHSSIKNRTMDGQVLEVLLNDVETFASNLLGIFYIVFSNFLKIIFCLIVVFSINVSLSMICLFFIPVYLCWNYYIANKMKQFTIEIKEGREFLSRSILDALMNIDTIKIYNLKKVINKYCNESINLCSNLLNKVKIYSNSISIISNIIVTFATFIPIFIGVQYVKNEELSIGTLIAFNTYIGMLFAPLTAIISQIAILKMNRVYEERIAIFLKIGEEKYEKLCTVDSKSGLEFYELLVSVENKVYIKVDSLKIESGDIVQIIGNNGVGKTLFLKSIVNLHPYQGSIYLNDKCLSTKTVSEISNEIIYVSNDQNFIFGTFEENIPMNNEFEKLAEIVCIHDRLKEFNKQELDNFYHIVKQLSSGEQQKLKLLRALNKKPKVLLLDEVFSHIEKNEANFILNNIVLNFPTIIIIMVEHHFSSNVITKVYRIHDRKLKLVCTATVN